MILAPSHILLHLIHRQLYACILDLLALLFVSLRTGLLTGHFLALCAVLSDLPHDCLYGSHHLSGHYLVLNDLYAPVRPVDVRARPLVSLVSQIPLSEGPLDLVAAFEHKVGCLVLRQEGQLLEVYFAIGRGPCWMAA
jgi:hypothetical protein